MPATDRILRAVKNALVKDGWTITADPLTLMYEGLNVYVDLAAERLLALEKGGERIAVEVKTFSAKSKVHEFETMLGQYVVYLTVLRKLDPDRKLFVAVGEWVYLDFLLRRGVQTVLREAGVPLIVVDLQTEEIVQWVHPTTTEP